MLRAVRWWSEAQRRYPADIGRTGHLRKFAHTGQIPDKRRIAPIVMLGCMSETPLLMTEYFRAVRTRPDRAIIRDDWILR